MAEYSPSQIIGKTIYAKKTVNVYTLPYDGQPVLRTVSKNMAVGVVYSFLSPSSQRSGTYWMFYNAYGMAYYVKHNSSELQLSSGALTIQEEKAAGKVDWFDKLLEPFGFTDGGLGKTVAKLGLGALAIYGGSQVVKAVQNGKLIRNAKRLLR